MDRDFLTYVTSEAVNAALLTYVTTKVVNAAPQEKDGQEGYQVVYPDGYVSWCPKETFERTSRLVTAAEFELVNAGCKD